jgi:histidyl-tRNA synthetase
MNIKPQTLKGFRDFLPETMAIRNKVINTLKSVFESYGFSGLQTPTLEYAEVLKGKYGEEAEKLMYLFKDNGGREIGLKYDLTVPLARVMTQYPNLPKPFKRYQIQPVFRAENTQKGRYREIYQCDVDTVGTISPTADAEILAIISDSLTSLKFNNFTIRINSRQILGRITDSPTILQSIDKLDKKTPQEIIEELKAKGVQNSLIQEIFSKLDSLKPDDHLDKVIDRAIKLGAKNIRFDPRLVRGLDYYTGPIFETVVTEPKIGSITGGGRYDNLIKDLGGPDLPATGTSFGLDRICDAIEETKLWPDLKLNRVRILVTVFDTELVDKSLALFTSLRRANIAVELYPEQRFGLDKQLKYASQKGIPYVAIIGPEEAGKNLIRLKNMQTREQQTVDLTNLISQLSQLS